MIWSENLVSNLNLHILNSKDDYANLGIIYCIICLICKIIMSKGIVFCKIKLLYFVLMWFQHVA